MTYKGHFFNYISTTKNARRAKDIFGEEVMDEHINFKIATAINLNEIQFSFWNLKTKKFQDEISIDEPFLIGARTSLWNTSKKYRHVEDKHYETFVYNKLISDHINEKIMVNKEFSNRRDLNKFKREVLEATCKTKKQRMLMIDYMRLWTKFSWDYDYDSDKNKPCFRFRLPYESDYYNCENPKSKRDKIFSIEKKLVRLGVNVKYVRYINLINHYKSTKTTLNGAMIRDYFLDKYNRTSEAGDFEKLFKNNPNFSSIYLNNNGYFMMHIPDNQKNTEKKLNSLLAVNHKVHYLHLPEHLRDKHSFIYHCFLKNYRKPLITHQRLTGDDDFIFEFIKEVGIYENLPSKTYKVISNNPYLSGLLSGHFVELFNKTKEINKKIRFLAEGKVEDFMKHILSKLNKSGWTDEVVNIFATHTRDYWKTHNRLHVQQSLSEKIGDFALNPLIFKNMPEWFREEFALAAIKHHTSNYKHLPNHLKQEGEVLLAISTHNIAKAQFKFKKGKEDWKFVKLCLENSKAFHNHETRTFIKITKITPCAFIRDLMIQIGIDPASIKETGYNTEVMEKLTKFVDYKIFGEKFPTKEVKTKKLKI